MSHKKYIEKTKKKDECIYSKSFHGLQMSNLNIQELEIHIIIVLSLLSNRSLKPNMHFLTKTSKLSILLTTYIVLALLRFFWDMGSPLYLFLMGGKFFYVNEYVETIISYSMLIFINTVQYLY